MKVWVIERIYENGETLIAGVYDSLATAVTAMNAASDGGVAPERNETVSDEDSEFYEGHDGEQWSIVRRTLNAPAGTLTEAMPFWR